LHFVLLMLSAPAHWAQVTDVDVADLSMLQRHAVEKDSSAHASGEDQEVAICSDVPRGYCASSHVFEGIQSVEECFKKAQATKACKNKYQVSVGEGEKAGNCICETVPKCTKFEGQQSDSTSGYDHFCKVKTEEDVKQDEALLETIKTIGAAAKSEKPENHSKAEPINSQADLEALVSRLGPLPADRRDDWLMDTPIETFVAHCTASVYGIGGGLQADLTNEYLKFYRDFNNKFVAIQVVVKGALEATDQLILYRRNDECVLAVSGTDDLYDAIQDISANTVDECGSKVHEGFWHEALRINSAFYKQDNAVLNYFTSDKCKKRYTTGHSLGGATIEIMTICMSPLKDMQLDGFFSFGAPGISLDPLPVDRELTMPNYRFWRTDPGVVDIVPWMCQQFAGMVHPKMRSIEIEKKEDGRYYKNEIEADDEEVADLPDGFDLTPRMLIHMYWEYENGLMDVYGD